VPERNQSVLEIVLISSRSPRIGLTTLGEYNINRRKYTFERVSLLYTNDLSSSSSLRVCVCVCAYRIYALRVHDKTLEDIKGSGELRFITCDKAAMNDTNKRYIIYIIYVVYYTLV